MSDFEGRVTEALRGGSADAPDALGLAAAARGRARAHRRQRVAAIGVGAVAALAIPLGVGALSGGDDGIPAPFAEDPVVQPLDGRWETWHGISVRVPDEWQYGDLATWCANGGSEKDFRISRPGGVTPMILCTPGSSYGISFQDIDMDSSDEPFDWPVVVQTGEAWPPGTFVGAHGEQGVLVTVAGPDREEVLEILATVGGVDPVDPNGCPTIDNEYGPTEEAADEVPVCRYDEEGRLVQSERLTGDDATAATDALTASEVVVGGRDCLNFPSEYVVMGVVGKRVEVQYAGNSLCGDRGVFTDGYRRQLTADLLFWALSPGWSGEIPPGVPFPEELRQ